MEFSEKRQRSLKAKLGDYVNRVQLYKIPPNETIDLKEFEELAEQRLKMLQKLDNIKQRASHEGKHKGDKEYISDVENGPLKDMPLTRVKLEMDEEPEIEKAREERRKDHLSHYILRLAYCRTEDMRRWFLGLETELLRIRFRVLYREEQKYFFSCYKDDFNFEIPDINKCEELGDQLSFYSIPEGNPENFYKVPFTDALDLVQSRQVVIKSGYVYIPMNNEDMIARLVCNKFRQQLSEELVKTGNNFSVVDDDDRIAPMLRTIQHRYLGEDFSNVGENLQGSISLAQIDSVSKQSFPPCMRHLHESLRKDHHLRHFGRLQYGLFLKSIGLTLEQAMAFWRAEFIKKMEPEKFEKQYAYNVRHSYGKEGKRANYTPYSCLKIILSNNPGQGDHHGCPFRHWDEAHIRQMLTTHGIPHKGVTNISNYVTDGHYQLACQKYYEITHAIEAAPFSLEHPSQYYRESRLQRGLLGVKQESPSIRQPTLKTEMKQEDFFGDISVEDMQNFEEDMDQF